MDPLKSQQLHDKTKIALNVRQWLNLTWRKHYLASVDVFDERTMPLISPYVIQQRNGYDCGLFIFRYALAFYQVSSLQMMLSIVI
jgi:Ulp1 family protease